MLKSAEFLLVVNQSYSFKDLPQYNNNMIIKNKNNKTHTRKVAHI
jgi:hypothetical protein